MRRVQYTREKATMKRVTLYKEYMLIIKREDIAQSVASPTVLHSNSLSIAMPAHSRNRTIWLFVCSKHIY